MPPHFVMKNIINKFFSEKADDSLLLPWGNEEFSKLMLVEHLNQNSLSGSRAKSFIQKEVRFLDGLFKQLSIGRKLLDIGCGPGLYCEQFNYFGYSCDGVDISPAAIEYAKEHVRDSQFFCCNIQDMECEKQYDAGLVLFGLLNEIKDSSSLISSAAQHIREDGYIILEVFHPDFFASLLSESTLVSGSEDATYFSALPHVRITKRFFVEESDCLVNRNLVVDDSGATKLYESHFTCYDLEKTTRLLESNGFTDVQCIQSPQTGEFSYESYYHYIIAKKQSLD
ncbi:MULTISPECIES: class I SAM-dependent methyltransferase [Vibrio]|uniref:Methyltransferase domain-containing protein n=2 Tax=Vibrio TaxID=662 RepID=A0A7X4LHI8_9VIBR|nr:MULTISPECIES: class I SAM-dependent methyltransferase [Vibrio]MBF9003124.1 class I SAM-dependent methyltransferase [Vibrio nitrifigilis]MZI91850.1 methyltransferase domain-containing protein [Vibrio eleionomae]